VGPQGPTFFATLATPSAGLIEAPTMPSAVLAPQLINELRRAAAHHQAGRLERAEALYLRLLKKAPTLAEPPYLLGAIAFERARHAYALQLAEDALRVRADFAPAHLLRGNALAAMGREAEAEACWRRTVELSPGEPAAHVNLALRLCQSDRADAALAHARHALGIDPTLFRAHYAAGLALLRLKSLAEAEAAFAAARRLAPDNIEILIAHGRIQCMLGMLDEAVGSLSLALASSPRDPEARRAHAEALLAQGQLAAAESALHALTADHPDPTTWSALGDMLRSTGRFEEAASAYRRALVTDSGFDVADFARRIDALTEACSPDRIKSGQRRLPRVMRVPCLPSAFPVRAGW